MIVDLRQAAQISQSLGHAPDGALLRRGMAQKVSNLAANRLITLWINRDC